MNNIEFYTASDTTPYVRYHKFLKFLTLNADVGNDSTDVIKRANKINAFLDNGDIAGAKTELSNMKMLYQFILNDITPSGLAAATMIKSIDGVQMEDLTIEGLQKTLELSGLTVKEVEENNEQIKKKSLLNWKFTFQKLSKIKALFTTQRN